VVRQGLVDAHLVHFLERGPFLSCPRPRAGLIVKERASTSFSFLGISDTATCSMLLLHGWCRETTAPGRAPIARTALKLQSFPFNKEQEPPEHAMPSGEPDSLAATYSAVMSYEVDQSGSLPRVSGTDRSIETEKLERRPQRGTRWPQEVFMDMQALGRRGCKQRRTPHRLAAKRAVAVRVQVQGRLRTSHRMACHSVTLSSPWDWGRPKSGSVPFAGSLFRCHHQVRYGGRIQLKPLHKAGLLRICKLEKRPQATCKRGLSTKQAGRVFSVVLAKAPSSSNPRGPCLM